MRAWILIVLASCGRIGFDATGTAGDDAPIEDDEDGDGVVDDMDLCPCTAGTQSDSDGDGVGDDCDYSATTTEQLVLFTTMKAGDQPFTTFGDGTWRQRDDALNFDGSDNGKLMVAITATNVRVTFGFEINAVIAPTEQHQIAVNANTSETIPHEFVELNEISGVVTHASVTFYNGADAYFVRRSSSLPAGFHTGRGEVQLTHLVGVSTTMDGGWVGEPYHLEFPTTLYTNATFAMININNLDVDIRYACVIATR